MPVAAKNPIRKAVADCSGYYETKGDAVRAVNDGLSAYGYQLVDCDDYHGNFGLNIVPFFSEHDDSSDCDNPFGYVSFSWYRLESGSYEFTVYVTL